ncbi:MAG: PDZ domain-containing protein, partial [Candidatus Cloacimonetes bacterium]|nr:PDZ domain-containing protein [Candidatus Cloacimonadota bacterium]
MKKRLIVILAIMLCGSFSLFAQDVPVEEINEEVEKAIEEAMEEVEKAMSEIQDIEPIIIRMEKLSPDTPKMGVYLSDMDFEDAYKMRYPYCYGVLVSGVVTGGPSQKAGIIKGDIIMEFDGRKAKFEDHLVKLIKSKNIGDEVEVKIFRDEEILLTKL